MQEDFFSKYMDYVGLKTSEAPAVYHRWVLASTIGAALGRQCWMEHGTGLVYPNQYIMLMGSPAARKGTAMGVGKKILRNAGFNRFAADRTSKERFLMDFKSFDEEGGMGIEELESLVMSTPAESYVFSGEFTDFIGPNNMEFLTLLTNLWDNLPEYEHKKITGKSVAIDRPTVNMIGANTPQGFAMAFPPEALGNGFLSRVIMVHGESNGVRVAWPKVPDPIVSAALSLHMRDIRDKVHGQFTVSDDAMELGDAMYNAGMRVEDPRYAAYEGRRLTHLLKLSMVIAAADLTTTIEGHHIVRANTMLAAAEKKMPLALGEYGKGRYAEVSGRVVDYLASRSVPATMNDIYKHISRDLSKVQEMPEILNALKAAERIQVITIAGKTGYMPLLKPSKEWPSYLLEPEWLTEEEQV